MMTKLQVLKFARRGIVDRISSIRDVISGCHIDSLKSWVEDLSALLGYLNEIDEKIKEAENSSDDETFS